MFFYPPLKVTLFLKTILWTHDFNIFDKVSINSNCFSFEAQLVLSLANRILFRLASEPFWYSILVFDNFFDTWYQLSGFIPYLSCPRHGISHVSRSPDFVYNFKITVLVLMSIAPGMVIVSGLFSGKARKSIYLLIIIPTDIIL